MDPLKPHFYIVKLGYAGINLFFSEAVLTCTHNLCFGAKLRKKKKVTAQILLQVYKFHYAGQ